MPRSAGQACLYLYAVSTTCRRRCAQQHTAWMGLLGLQQAVLELKRLCAWAQVAVDGSDPDSCWLIYVAFGFLCLCAPAARREDRPACAPG